MSYTAQEVSNALEGFEWDYEYKYYNYEWRDGKYGTVGDEITDIVRAEFYWDEDALSHLEGIETPVGLIEIVKYDGGYEGGGSEIELVIRTVSTGQLFKKQGSYSSYEGEQWDGELKETREVERMVVFYE